MALSVRSPSLRYVSMDRASAALVAHAMATESRAFYCEPQPGDRVRVYVESEHAARVCQLACLETHAIKTVPKPTLPQPAP